MIRYLLILLLLTACTKKDDSNTTVVESVDQSIELSQVFKKFFATDSLSTDIVYSPQGVNFGEIKINKKITKNIQISNGPLLEDFSSNIKIEELSPKIFTLDSSNCSLIKSGQNCQIKISAMFTDLLFTSTKTARLILGKKDGVEIYMELYASILGTSISSNQFESNYSIWMGNESALSSQTLPASDGFSSNYTQYVFQERIIRITNNSATRYLRNDYILPQLTSSNPSNFYISSNQCLYPVASGKSCNLRIIYKKWKTTTTVSDTDLMFPDKSQNFSLRYGKDVTYTPVLSDFGACSASSVCSGVGTQTRSIAQCLKNGVDPTDIESCSTSAPLSQSCNSPAGSQTINITGGTVGQSCAEGATTWVNDSVNCNTDYHQGIGYVCVADVFVPTLSDYSPQTNPLTLACSGSTTATRTILACSRQHNGEIVPISKCSDPNATITYKSPVGNRSSAISNGVLEETCAEGATLWTVSNVICNNGYYRNGNECDPIVYVPTYSAYNTSLVSSTVCSGQDTVYRSITNCVRQDSNQQVATSNCSDPTPSKIVESPAGTQLISLFDSLTTLQSGTQSQFCAKGSTTWQAISTSCFPYYTAQSNQCNANPLTAPQSPQMSGTVYSNQSSLSFTATTDANATSLNIYSNSSCSNQIGTAISLGASVWNVGGNVSLNSTTPIYAKSQNSYTTRSSNCTYLFTYVHDNIAPQANFVINNGASSTTLGSVQLNFSSVSDNNPIQTLTVWESNNCSGAGNDFVFANTVAYTLLNKGGVIPLSVKIKDVANNESNCLTDSIDASISSNQLYTANTKYLQFINNSNQSCSGTEECREGSILKVVNLEQTTCQNLNLNDSLNVFKWECEADPINSGRVRFVSKRFADNQGLSSLIDDSQASPQWKSISLSLTNNSGIEITKSTNFYPFSNPLSYLSLSCVDGSNTPQSYTDYDSCNSAGYQWIVGSLTSTLQIGDLNNTIYVVRRSNPSFNGTEQVKTYQINLNVDQNSLVIMPGVQLFNLSNSLDAITVSGRKFFYLQGSIFGGGLASLSNNVASAKISNSKYGIINLWTAQNFSKGLVIDQSQYISGKDISITSSGQEGISILTSYKISIDRASLASNNYSGLKLSSTTDSYFAHISATNQLSSTLGYGIEVVLSSNNSFFENMISNNRSSGLYLNGSSNNIFVSNISSANSNYGVFLNGSSLNNFISLESSFNNSYGVMVSGSDKNTIHIGAIFNNEKSGIHISASNQSFLSQIATFVNTNSSANEAGLALDGSLYNKISGNIYSGLNTQLCARSGTSASNNLSGLDSSCQATGFSDFSATNISSYPNLSSFATQTQSSFNYSPSLFVQFLSFPQVFQKSNTSFDTSARGVCSTGACQVYDRTLNLNDSVLFNRTNLAIQQNSSSFISASSNCPVEVGGDLNLNNGACVISGSWSASYLTESSCLSAGGSWSSLKGSTSSYTAPNKFLKNAIEIIDPNATGYSLGNHDGLCESGESCFYAPNFGAYQGTGVLNSCSFQSNGGISDIFMRGWSQNGAN